MLKCIILIQKHVVEKTITSNHISMIELPIFKINKIYINVCT